MGGPVGLKAALKAAVASKDVNLAAKAAEASANEPSLKDSELRMVALKMVRDKGTSRQAIDSHSAGGDAKTGLMNFAKSAVREGEDSEEDLDEGSCGSRDDDEDVQEEAAKPDFPDVDGDGDREEPISKAQKEKKEKKDDDAEKQEESKIQTPEQENTLYENRFSGKNDRLYQKLLKEWAK